MKGLAAGVAGSASGVLLALCASSFAPACSSTCGERPPDPDLGEYLVVESTHDWLTGAKVTVARGEYRGMYAVTISPPDGGPTISYDYFGVE